MQINPYLLFYIKPKSQWITDLNTKPDTLNLIEEKVGNCIKYIGTGDNFLNRIPTAQTLRSIINKSDLGN